MSPAGAEQREPAVSMRALLAAGAAATAVSTPPRARPAVREPDPDLESEPESEAGPEPAHTREAAPESEAA
ncbi:hypothetical protein ACWDYJ_25495 [Streptomyces sp. NPDC003042]